MSSYGSDQFGIEDPSWHAPMAPDVSVDPVSGGFLPPTTGGSDFVSAPGCGLHPIIDPGNDWRSGNGLGDIVERMVSYGNFAGPSNKMEIEQADYIAAQRAAAARAGQEYDPYVDPVLMNDPRYQPIDAVDAAARDHDHGYELALDPGQSFFAWDGMNAVNDVDRNLVAAVDAEMDAHGDQYSPASQTAAEGLEGFFGSRVKGGDAIDWTGDKLGDVGQAAGGFLADARSWGSVGDAVSGVGGGLFDAASWLSQTGQEAQSGMAGAYGDCAELGTFGKLCTIAGYANVAGAGGLHVAEQAADWLTA